jgi:hypothetical protein
LRLRLENSRGSVIQSVMEMAFLLGHGIDYNSLPYKQLGHLSTRKHRNSMKYAGLVALACQEPPEGRSRWTLRLLADRMVALEYVDQLSYQTVRRTLKKTRSSLG